MMKLNDCYLQSAVLVDTEEERKLDFFLKTRHTYEKIVIEERVSTGKTLGQLVEIYGPYSVAESFELSKNDIERLSLDTEMIYTCTISLQANFNADLTIEDILTPEKMLGGIRISESLTDFIKVLKSNTNNTVDTKIVASYMNKNTILEGDTIRYMYLGDRFGGLCYYMYFGDDNLSFLGIDGEVSVLDTLKPIEREVEGNYDSILFIPSNKDTFSLDDLIRLHGWNTVVSIDLDEYTTKVIVGCPED